MNLLSFVDTVILVSALLLLTGVLTTKFSARFGMPALVLFIALGMILSRYVYYDNAEITQLVGIFALIVILFQGGMQTEFKEIRPVLGPALSLATVGVLLTTTVIGLCATYILDISLEKGLLIGAIVGSTDAAAVFSVLGGLNIKERITSTLEAESGSNDPMAVFLTVSLIEWIKAPDISIGGMILSFFMEMGLGLVVGILVGFLAVYIINRINFDSSGLYPVMALGFAILTYGAAELIHSSGLLAVYVMALVLGNTELTYRRTILAFNQGFAWMMQIAMFVLLGLLVFPNQLTSIAWQGLLLSLLLMFVARPMGVLLSLLFTKFAFREKMMIAWAGLRGAVPIVLATYPLIAGIEGGQMFFNVVFFVVLTSAIIQGTTISPLAVKLKLIEKDKPQAPSLLELFALGKANSEINHVQVQNNMPVIGQEIQNLNLPDDILFTAIIRKDRIITPKGNTILEQGDTVYVMSPKTKREQMKSIFGLTGSGLEKS
ncbi:potassium/proton antiporter [Paenibacillus sp. N3/727]|uniref:potassium/proton antiporter n=1 Tax=Paenibacillus sp. N3/727 TaxID=2925845 RepID=UPI001F538248|nr:potassium/proton antiporter [Paenibacillus sp. N3/727]UNK19725.1 potassium/proton antiporter [Paenibacillus sp. N3/727]